MDNTKDIPILSFSTQTDWHQWLDKNHTNENGLWLRIYKKQSKVQTVSYAEALDEALCYGWIDGQKKKYDEHSYLQKFTPRRKNSLWSKRNVEYITRLIEAERMQPSGLKEVEDAQADGRWEKAYDSPSKMETPDDLLKELAKNKKAETFFKTLNKTNTYAINWRLQTAKKPETRQRRMQKILKMLEKGKKFY